MYINWQELGAGSEFSTLRMSQDGAGKHRVGPKMLYNCLVMCLACSSSYVHCFVKLHFETVSIN